MSFDDFLDTLEGTKGIPPEKRQAFYLEIANSIPDEGTSSEQRADRHFFMQAAADSKNKVLQQSAPAEHPKILGQFPTPEGIINQALMRQPETVTSVSLQNPALLGEDLKDAARALPRAITTFVPAVMNLEDTLQKAVGESGPVREHFNTMQEWSNSSVAGKAVFNLMQTLPFMGWPLRGAAQFGGVDTPADKAYAQETLRLRELMKDDPKAIEGWHTALLDAAATVLTGGGGVLRSTVSGAYKAAAKEAATLSIAGATGGQVTEGLLGDTLENAIENPDTASMVTLGATIIGAMAAGISVENVLTKVGASTTAASIVKATGQAAANGTLDNARLVNALKIADLTTEQLDEFAKNVPASELYVRELNSIRNEIKSIEDSLDAFGPGAGNELYEDLQYLHQREAQLTAEFQEAIANDFMDNVSVPESGIANAGEIDDGAPVGFDDVPEDFVDDVVQDASPDEVDALLSEPNIMDAPEQFPTAQAHNLAEDLDELDRLTDAVEALTNDATPTANTPDVQALQQSALARAIEEIEQRIGNTVPKNSLAALQSLRTIKDTLSDAAYSFSDEIGERILAEYQRLATIVPKRLSAVARAQLYNDIEELNKLIFDNMLVDAADDVDDVADFVDIPALPKDPDTAPTPSTAVDDAVPDTAVPADDAPSTQAAQPVQQQPQAPAPQPDPTPPPVPAKNVQSPDRITQWQELHKGQRLTAEMQNIIESATPTLWQALLRNATDYVNTSNVARQRRLMVARKNIVSVIKKQAPAKTSAKAPKSSNPRLDQLRAVVKRDNLTQPELAMAMKADDAQWQQFLRDSANAPQTGTGKKLRTINKVVKKNAPKKTQPKAGTRNVPTVQAQPAASLADYADSVTARAMRGAKMSARATTLMEDAEFRGAAFFGQNRLAALYGRRLTTSERVVVVNDIAANADKWRGKNLASAKKATPGTLTLDDFNQRFPNLAKIAKLIAPNADMFTAGRVSRLDAADLIGAIGKGTGPKLGQKAYEALRPVLMEAQLLWDELRMAGQVAEQMQSSDLLAVIKDVPQTADMLKAFDKLLTSRTVPSMNFAPYADGATPYYDSMTRTASTDAYAALHEVGHHIYRYALNASERMAFIDWMREQMTQPKGWERAFPEYDNILSQGKGNAQEPFKRYWVESPEEAFSQQFALVLKTHRVPDGRSATLMQKAFDTFATTFGMRVKDLSKIHPDLLRMFAKASFMRNANRYVLETTGSFEDIVADLPTIPDDPREALAKADEIEELLQLDNWNKSSITARTGDDADEIFDAFDTFEDVEDEFVTIADDVLRVRIADIPKALAMMLTRGLTIHPKFNMQQFKLLIARAQEFLRQPPAEVATAIQRQEYVRVRASESSIDAQTGLPVTQADRAQDWINDMQMQEAEALRHGLIPNRQNTIAFSNLNKQLVQQFKQANGRKPTADEKAVIWKKTGDMLNESKSQRRSASEVFEEEQMMHKYEAFVNETRTLLEGAQKLLVSKGEADNLPSAYLGDMNSVNHMADMAANDWSTLKNVAYGTLWRSAALMVSTAYSDDENGFQTPFGKVSFSLSAALDKGVWGMAGLALAGGTPAKLAGKGLYAVGARAIARLTPDKRKALNGLVRKFRENLGAQGGLSNEMLRLQKTYQRTATNFQREHMELASALADMFNPYERSIISMLVTKDVYPGFEEGVRLATNQQRLMAVAITNLYGRTRQALIQSGVPGKSLPEQRLFVRDFLEVVDKPKATVYGVSDAPSGVRMKFATAKGFIHDTSGNSGAINDIALDDRRSVQELRKSLHMLTPQELYSTSIDSFVVRTVDARGNMESFRRVYALRDTPLHDRLSESPMARKDAQSWRTHTLTTSKLKLQRDYTHIERAALGETMDAAVKLMNFGNQAARDIAKFQMFDQMALLSDHVLDASDPVLAAEGMGKGWELIPESLMVPRTGIPAFGNLNGKYISPEMRTVLDNIHEGKGAMAFFRENAPNAYSMHRIALGMWKLGKTAFVPATHITNFVGNIMQSWIAGNNPATVLYHGLHVLRVRNMMKRLQRARTMRDNAAMAKINDQLRNNPTLRTYWDTYRQAVDYQLDETNLLISDESVQSLLENVVNIRDALRVDASMADVTSLATGVEQTLMQSWGNRMKRFGKMSSQSAKRLAYKTGEVYELGDMVFKWGTLHDKLAQGRNIDDSISDTFKAHFDYSTLPKIPALMRDSGLVPFVSYAYKSALLMADSALQRPDRLVIAALVGEAVHARTMAATYGIENTLAAMETESAASKRPGRASHSWGIIRNEIAVGSRLEEMAAGNVGDMTRYFSVGNYVPGGDLLRGNATLFPETSDTTAARMAMGGISSMGNVLLGSPVFSLAAAAATGQDVFLNRPIGTTAGRLTDYESEKRFVTDFMDYFTRTMLPNLPFIPGSYSNKRLWQGLAHEGLISAELAAEKGVTGYDSIGQPRDLTTQLLSMGGIRLQSIDPAMQLEYQAGRIARERATQKGDITKARRNWSIPAQRVDEMIEEFWEAEEKRQDKSERIWRTYDRSIPARQRQRREARQDENIIRAGETGKPVSPF